MADDNPYVSPEMDPTLRKQIQECNWQIVNVTTPANFFHVLRRQVGIWCNQLSYKLLFIFLIYVFVCFLLMPCGLPLQLHREFRKPLIVMSPKNLLRHKECKSNLSEFDDVQGHPGFDKQGTRFKRLIKDRNNHSDLEDGIRRLVLCSGKVCLRCTHVLTPILEFLCIFMRCILKQQSLYCLNFHLVCSHL